MKSVNIEPKRKAEEVRMYTSLLGVDALSLITLEICHLIQLTVF